MSGRAATAGDREAIRRLLTEGGLPAEDLDRHLSEFRLVKQKGSLIACAALERFGADGYLRSVAVAARARGTGLGARLTEEMMSEAAAGSLRAVWLMTLSAEAFFAQRAFVRVPREEAPPWLRAHEHFQTYCPVGAILMRRALPG